MAFVCMSPARLLEEDPPVDPVQEGKDGVQEALNAVEFDNKDKLVLCLPGGGITAPGMGRNPEMAVVGPFVAVLSGSLQNYAYLVRKYCLEDLSLPAAISLEAIRERTPIREAALVCKLYERLGTGMLTKLRGKFAFCLYDSSTMRVLAARDPSGDISLVQGRAEGEMLFLACGENMPPGSHSVRDIAPGQFVYGWGADPKKYASPLQEVEKHATQAVGAAAMALKGIKLKPDGGKKAGGRRSLDSLRRNSPDTSHPAHRRMSVDNKRSGTPDVDGWRKPRGGRKQRRNSARASHQEDGQNPPRHSQDSKRTRSLDSERTRSIDSRGSSTNKEDRKAKTKPQQKGKRMTQNTGTGHASPKSVVDGAGSRKVDCPLPVAPVH